MWKPQCVFSEQFSIAKLVWHHILVVLIGVSKTKDK